MTAYKHKVVRISRVDLWNEAYKVIGGLDLGGKDGWHVLHVIDYNDDQVLILLEREVEP